MRRVTWCVIGWISLMLPTVQAASFNCGKASTKIENLICGDPDLSKLDESLNQVYQQAIGRSDDKQETTKEQKKWLKEVRDACQDVACMKHVYEARVHELTSVIIEPVSTQATRTPASSGHYDLVKGNGIELCEAYKRNFEYFDNTMPMACERKYNPEIKGFASPKWQNLDFKKYFELYKKAAIYANGLPRVQGTALSKEDLRKHIEELDTVPPESFKTEFYLAQLDFDGNGKPANVLAIRRVGCGPDRATNMNENTLYLLNNSLSDFDYRRQDSWQGWHQHATVELFKGKPYIEVYQGDNWGQLLTGGGWFYVFQEETPEQIAKEFPDNEVESRLKSICEFRYLPSADESKK